MPPCEVRCYLFIESSSLFVLMAMILRSALLLSFRKKRFVLCLDFSVMDSTPKSYGSLRFSIVFGKTLSVEHCRRKKSLCLLVAKVSLLRNIFLTRTSRPYHGFRRHLDG